MKSVLQKPSYGLDSGFGLDADERSSNRAVTGHNSKGFTEQGGNKSFGLESEASSSNTPRPGGDPAKTKAGISQDPKPVQSSSAFGLNSDSRSGSYGLDLESPKKPAASQGYGLHLESSQSKVSKSGATYGLDQENNKPKPGPKYGLDADGPSYAASRPSSSGKQPGSQPEHGKPGASKGYGLDAEAPGAPSNKSSYSKASGGGSYGLEAEGKGNSYTPGLKSHEVYGMARARETPGGAGAGAHRRTAGHDKSWAEDGDGAASQEWRRRRAGPDMPRMSGAGPMNLQEVTQAGRPYLLDRSSGLVYKDVSAHAAPELVGKWVGERVVFTPPTTEMELYTELAAYLQRKELALEDVFAALDGDLDGCLRTGPGSAGYREMGRLVLDVMPGLPTSFVQLFCSLADFDGDGYVSLQDVQAAGSHGFEAACEYELGGRSPLATNLHEVAVVLTDKKAHCQLVASSLDAEGSGWLEPAGWVRFLRAVCPHLSPCQLRYVLAHIYCGPEDNRKSLSEVTRALISADEAYVSAARLGRGPPPKNRNSARDQSGSRTGGDPDLLEVRARARAKSEAVMDVLRKPGYTGGRPPVAHQGGTASPTRQPGASPAQKPVASGKQQEGAAPTSISLVANPRGAVSAWFSALASYLDKQPGSQAPGQKGLALRSLLRACDSNDDGYLDNAGMRTLVQTIMPTVTDAQVVYIKAALNPSNGHLISYEEVTRSLARFSAGLAWDTPHGGRAPLDSLHILATFLQDNKAKLQVLMSMFDSDGDGLLGDLDLLRLLRFVQPSLRDRQLDLCLAQLRSQVDRDRDGLVSLQDLRLALQKRQESVAALRLQAAAAAGVSLGPDSQGGLYGTADHRYTPAVPKAHDAYAMMSTDPWDPFTLASLAALHATENGSHLPAHTHVASQRQASQQASAAAGMTALRAKAYGHPAQVVLDDPSRRQVQESPPGHLDPLTYCGYTYLHDAVSNLVYLPVRNAPGTPQDGAPVEIKGTEMAVLQQQCTLLLFGRLRPDKHVQRVETAAANALFAALDQQLKATKQTLGQLVQKFTPKHTSNGGRPGVAAGRPGYGAHSSPTPATLDLVGVKELIHALIPAWAAGRGVAHYFMALFDLDGDGLVDVDDMMDAFEEAGTTVDTLQTPAHVVHAKAYKLLARLAAHVTRGATQEQQVATLFHTFDTQHKGGLTLPELSRFISALSFKAAFSQAASQEDLIGQPTASPVQAASGAYAGNALAAGASSDDVGALCVFLASKVVGGGTVLSWAALVQVMRQASTQLPTEIRDASPRRSCSPSRYSHMPPPAPQHIQSAPNTPGQGSKVYDTELPLPHRTRDQMYSAGGTGPTDWGRPVPASAAGTVSGGPMYTNSHSVSTVTGSNAKAGSQVAHAQEVHHHHHHHHRHVYVQGQSDSPRASPRDDYLSDGSLVTGRHMPLRGDTGCGASQRGPQPGRREVQLMHHTTLSSDTPGTQQQVLLLDPCTGLLYRAPSELYDTKPLPEATRVAPTTQPWTPHAMAPAAKVKAQAYARPGSGGGAPLSEANSSGLKRLSYPELAGRIQAPDNRLIPAPLPTLSGLFKVLAAAAQDAYQVRTLFKMYDRDGKGLDVEGLHQVLSAIPMASTHGAVTHSQANTSNNVPQVVMGAEAAYSAACGGSTRTGHLRISQSDLLHAALDVSGNKRITLDELIKGISPAATSQEVTGARVPADTHAEQRAIRVLHNASSLISGSMKAFWLLYSQADPRGVGYIDLDVACGLLSQLMAGVPAADLEIINAYLGAACLGPTRDISPDELLQLFHVLPLRYNGPLLTRKTGLTPRSNPFGNTGLDAPSSILASCLASDDEGVVFQPGFVPVEPPRQTKVAGGPRPGDSPHMVPAEPQYVGNTLPAYYQHAAHQALPAGVTPVQYEVQRQQQYLMHEAHHMTVWSGPMPALSTNQGPGTPHYQPPSTYPGPAPPGLHLPPTRQPGGVHPVHVPYQPTPTWDVRRFPPIFTRTFPHVPSAYRSPHTTARPSSSMQYFASRYPFIRSIPFYPVQSKQIHFSQPPWNGQPPSYTQPPYNYNGFMMKQYFPSGTPPAGSGTGGWDGRAPPAPGGPPYAQHPQAHPSWSQHHQQVPYSPPGSVAQYHPQLGHNLQQHEYRPRLDLEAGPPDWHVPRDPRDKQMPVIKRGAGSGYGLDVESPHRGRDEGCGLDMEQPRKHASSVDQQYLTRNGARTASPGRQDSYGLMEEEGRSPRVDVTLSKWDTDPKQSASPRYGSPARDQYGGVPRPGSQAGYHSGPEAPYRPHTPGRNSYDTPPESPYGSRLPGYKETEARQHSSGGYQSGAAPGRPMSPAINIRPDLDDGQGNRRPTSPAVSRPGELHSLGKPAAYGLDIQLDSGSGRPTSPAPANRYDSRSQSPAPGRDTGKGYGLDGEATGSDKGYSKWDDPPRKSSYGLDAPSSPKPPAKPSYGLESDSGHHKPTGAKDSYGLGQEPIHKPSPAAKADYGLGSESSYKAPGKNEYGLGSDAPPAKSSGKTDYGLGLGPDKPKSTSGHDKPYSASGSKADSGFGLGDDRSPSQLSKPISSAAGKGGLNLKASMDDDYGLDGFEDDDSLSPSPRPGKAGLVGGLLKNERGGRPASPLPSQARRQNSSDDDF